MTEPTLSGPNPVVVPPTRGQRMFATVRHVYHTRIRTTTVVLIVLWFGLLAFFGFSSEHYDPTPPRTSTQVTDDQQPARRTVEPTRETTTTTTPTATSTTQTSTVEDTPTSVPGRETAPPETTVTSETVERPGAASTTPERSTER